MGQKVRRLIAIIDSINDWEGKIVSFVFIVATIQICYELTRRYLFNSPTIWGLELTVYLCSTSYVMSGGYALLNESHIRVDVLYNRWSTRTKAIFDASLSDLILFFFSGILLWQSGKWCWEAIREGCTSGTIWDVPIWPMRLLIFLGALSLLLQGVAKFVRDLGTAVHSK